jgi:hypothetical protein
MSEPEEKLPAELRMKLLEVEKFKEQSYPDWKRGFRFALLGLFSAAVVFPVAYLATLESDAAGRIYYPSAGIVAAVMVIAFAFGAFRPPR